MSAWGSPLVGTSWLNRPYYVGGDLGTFWITRSVEDSVARDVDTFGGIFFGCDWDHYWGNELPSTGQRPSWSTATRRTPDEPTPSSCGTTT